MTFHFSVPTPSGAMNFEVEPGTSLLFVGANGGGKTRLAVKIEDDLGDKAHRISAHRALNLNPSVPKISERLALQGLRTGYADEGALFQHRTGNRWGNKAPISLLNDYDFLVQSLFGEQANTSLATHKNVRDGTGQPASLTNLRGSLISGIASFRTASSTSRATIFKRRSTVPMPNTAPPI